MNKAGDTLSGSLNMGAQSITNLPTPSAASDAATKGYADGAFVRKDGTTHLTGPWNIGTQDLSSIGNMALAASKTLNLGTYGVDPAGLGAADKGKVWFNTATNQMKYWDGSSVQALGVSGAGLTSLGAQSGSAQTFAVSTAGTAPAINSSVSKNGGSVLYYEDIKNGQFKVKLAHGIPGNQAQEFSWLVMAERKGPALQVEPRKDEIEVKEFGPYRYYTPTK